MRIWKNKGESCETNTLLQVHGALELCIKTCNVKKQTINKITCKKNNERK